MRGRWQGHPLNRADGSGVGLTVDGVWSGHYRGLEATVSVGLPASLTYFLRHLLWTRCETESPPSGPYLGEMGRVCGKGLNLEVSVCVCVSVSVCLCV